MLRPKLHQVRPYSLADGIMSAESSPHIPDAEHIDNDPIISRFKAPFDRYSSGWAVSADQRKPVCTVKQTACAEQPRQRLCRSHGCRRQDAAGELPPGTQGKEQDRA